MLRWIAAGLLSLPHVAMAQDAPPLAKILTVAEGDGAITRQFFGHVVAKQTVDLAFQVGGQIVELPVLEGTPVTKGSLVARLDTEPFQLALDQAQAQQDQADRTLERMEKLEGNTVSQVTVDDATTQADLTAIATRNAARNLELATLNAPFDGIIASRNVANFTTVQAGMPIVRMHDMSELRVDIEVPEVLFQRAGRDPDLELTATFPRLPGSYDLEPREFNAETSDKGQTYRITLALTDPGDLVVLPGSSVNVTASLLGNAPQIVIPQSALIADTSGAPRVMLFTPSGTDPDIGTVQVTEVSITPSANGDVLVTEGLSPGDQIIASGAALLSDGDAVRRFTGFDS